MAQSGGIKSKRERDPATNQMAMRLNAGDIERILYEREHPQEIATRPTPGAKNGKAVKALQPVQSVQVAPSLPAQQPKPWLTVREAEEYSGLPARFLIELIGNGQLPAYNVGPRRGGRWRIARRDLDALPGIRPPRSSDSI